MFPSIVITVFSSLTWPDTQVCNKSVGYCLPMLKQLDAAAQLTADDACHMFSNMLQALELQGQHEGQQAMLLGTGLQIYTFLVGVPSDVLVWHCLYMYFFTCSIH